MINRAITGSPMVAPDVDVRLNELEFGIIQSLQGKDGRETEGVDENSSEYLNKLNIVSEKLSTHIHMIEDAMVKPSSKVAETLDGESSLESDGDEGRICTPEKCGDDCSDGNSDEGYGEFFKGDIDIENEHSPKKLVGSYNFVQVQDEAALVPSEILDAILTKKDETPIANVTQSDLEEANENKFGKTIEKSECLQGVRQNAQTEIPKLNAQASMPVGKEKIENTPSSSVGLGAVLQVRTIDVGVQCANEKGNVELGLLAEVDMQVQIQNDIRNTLEIRKEKQCTKGVRQNASKGKNSENSECGASRPMSFASAVTKRAFEPIFSAKSTMMLEYTPYKRGLGVPCITLTPEPEAVEKWTKCLVGYFIGAKVPYHIVRREVFKAWSKEGLIKMTSTDTGVYLFEFVNDEARDKVNENGLFHVFGKVMVLKKWHLMMSLTKEAMEKVPIWVRFYNLPYEYWSASSLSKISSMIGKPLYVDHATENLLRVSYARVCIEINAGEDRVDVIKVKNGDQVVDVMVEYQWSPPRCDKCRVFGHSFDKCPVTKGKGEARTQEWREVKNQDSIVQQVISVSKEECTSKGLLNLQNSFDVFEGFKEEELGEKTRTKLKLQLKNSVESLKNGKEEVTCEIDQSQKLFETEGTEAIQSSEPTEQSPNPLICSAVSVGTKTQAPLAVSTEISSEISQKTEQPEFQEVMSPVKEDVGSEHSESQRNCESRGDNKGSKSLDSQTPKSIEDGIIFLYESYDASWEQDDGVVKSLLEEIAKKFKKQRSLAGDTKVQDANGPALSIKDGIKKIIEVYDSSCEECNDSEEIEYVLREIGVYLISKSFVHDVKRKPKDDEGLTMKMKGGKMLSNSARKKKNKDVRKAIWLAGN